MCQEQGQAERWSLIVYVRDAMYSSYTSILLVVVTHCCLYSRYQQAEIGRAGTSRHQLLTHPPSFEAIPASKLHRNHAKPTILGVPMTF
jgi:hypothetical protein